MSKITIKLTRGVDIIADQFDKNGKLKKSGVPSFMGSMKISQLIPRKEIPIYDKQISKQNYQRLPKAKRLEAVRDRIFDDPNDPTIFSDSINLNIGKEYNEGIYSQLLVPINAKDIGPGSHWVLTIDESDDKLFRVVDGQTRVVGTEMAIQMAQQSSSFGQKVSDLNNIYFNFNLTFTSNFLNEIMLFYLINNYSKNLPPEGAARLLYLHQHDVFFAKEVKKRPQGQREIACMEVAEILMQGSGPWSNHILDYNETKGPGHIGHCVNINALANSLIVQLLPKVEELIRDGWVKLPSGMKSTTYTAELIDKFWEALEICFPEMHDSSHNIMRSSQAEVIFMCHAKLVEKYFTNSNFQSKFGGIVKPTKLAPILDDFIKNTKDQAADGTSVNGKNCWLKGKSGAMGKYTSKGAKKQCFETTLYPVLEASFKTKTGITP